MMAEGHPDDKDLEQLASEYKEIFKMIALSLTHQDLGNLAQTSHTINQAIDDVKVRLNPDQWKKKIEAIHHLRDGIKACETAVSDTYKFATRLRDPAKVGGAAPRKMAQQEIDNFIGTLNARKPEKVEAELQQVNNKIRKLRERKVLTPEQTKDLDAVEKELSQGEKGYKEEWSKALGELKRKRPA
jgi:hypothetical protein